MSIEQMIDVLIKNNVIHDPSKYKDNQIIAIYYDYLDKLNNKKNNNLPDKIPFERKFQKNCPDSFVKDGIEYESEDAYYDALEESTQKTKSGKWVNKGKDGTHGTFKTKKAADAQRKAMFANGYIAEKLTLKESFDIDEFKQRFGRNYNHFYRAYEDQAKIKFGDDWENHAYEFIRMFDLTDSKLGKINDCYYNKEKNKIIMYDQYNQPIAVCNCKDGWSAYKVKSKYDLTEDINEEKQYQINFPLIVTYECDNKSIDKSSIDDFDSYEQSCIEKYAKQVLTNFDDNSKFICETLDVFDVEFEYDGYDDNFQIFFIMKAKSENIPDETIIKAIRRYVNFEESIVDDVDDNEVLFTAIPVVASTTNFKIEKI